MSKIIIVGCGIVGATLAYELSLIPQLKITVLEKDQPASGSTGSALGVMMAVVSGKTKGRTWRLRETSLQRYQSLIPELEAKTGITIPVNYDGIVKLLFAEDKLDKWQKLAQTRSQQGWNLEILTPGQLQQRCPQVAANKVIGAVYSPSDRQINPQILTKVLVAAAQANGVEFQFQTDCKIPFLTSESDLDASSENKRCNLVETSTAKLDCDRLIIAAGLGSAHLTRSLAAAVDIRPVLGQALKLQFNQDLGLESFQPTITGNDILFVPLGDRQYWLGATVEFPDEDGKVVAQPNTLTEFKQKAEFFCPAIADAKILASWQGKRPRPFGQAAPVIGKLEGFENVWLATAHYRNGVLLAPGTAQEIKRSWGFV